MAFRVENRSILLPQGHERERLLLRPVRRETGGHQLLRDLVPPLLEEIPGFVEVYNKHKGKGFELIGISLDTDSRENMPGFIMNNKVEYRILFGDLDTARAYGGVAALPTTFFVGKDGEIKNIHVGYIGKDAFDKEVMKLL